MQPTKPTSLLEWLDKKPPFLVYALSRTGKRGPTPNSKRLTYRQMITRSGLRPATFGRLTGRISWSNVKTNVIDGFCRGCGVDLLHFSKHSEYIRRAVPNGKFGHLSDRQWATFKRLAAKWMERNTKA
jgi:hypothetical protein